MTAKLLSLVVLYCACLVVLTNAVAIGSRYNVASKRQFTYGTDIKESCGRCLVCMVRVANWFNDLEDKCMGESKYCQAGLTTSDSSEVPGCPLSTFQNFEEFADLSAQWLSKYILSTQEGSLNPMARRVKLFVLYQYESFSDIPADEDVDIYTVLTSSLWS
ncbi:uncharacterized protein LOC144440845 [Glandiceps talaboti]